jgi:hypothetical protein
MTFVLDSSLALFFVLKDEATSASREVREIVRTVGLPASAFQQSQRCGDFRRFKVELGTTLLEAFPSTYAGDPSDTPAFRTIRAIRQVQILRAVGSKCG